MGKSQSLFGVHACGRSQGGGSALPLVHSDHLRIPGIPSGPYAVGAPAVLKVQLFPHMPQGVPLSPPPCGPGPALPVMKMGTAVT